MKTLFFTTLVVICAVYLLSQTDSGDALLSRFLPGSQIEQTSDTLLTKVDSRLVAFSEQLTLQQNQKLHALEQQISQLTTLLANQQAQINTKASRSRIQPEDKDLATNRLAENIATKSAATSRVKNDALNLPPPLSTVKSQTIIAEESESFKVAVNSPTSHTHQLRQKQAALQDIATRMEQVSLQAFSGQN